ncbi:hypothetical protein EC991_006727 [Linnemannia zychae]|nr:hypothetical protein EC991_006727 [Linnemannia zychae]
MGSSHRPPVLFQSDDDDHHHINNHGHHDAFGDGHNAESRSTSRTTGLLGHQHNDILHGQSSAHVEAGRGHSQERGHGHLYDELENLDDPPPHVHSQACLDSCPVQDIYTETSFSRFSKGARTNLYGLAVVKELGQATAPPTTSTGVTHSESLSPSVTTLDASGATQEANTPRSKTSIFTENGDLAYRHLPGRYVLVAAGGTVKLFLGLHDMFEFTLGPSDPSVPQGTGVEGGSSGGGVATVPPPNLEIVSLDAFERKDERGCQLVLVVAIAKAEDPVQFELRFYGVNTFAPSIRELLLQLPSTTDMQAVPLNWAPTKIIHAPLEDDPFEMVVLVGGSDSCVHVFVQDAPTTASSASQEIVPSDNLFKEQPVETLFSVLASFPYCEYCVLSLVIKDYPTYRVIAAGTQNGTLNVGVIPRDPITFQLDRANAKAHTVVLFSPITTLTVYTSRVQTERRRSQRSQRSKQAGLGDYDAGLADADQNDEEFEEEEDGIHLLVTCAIEQAWVYSDINNYGLSRRSDLAECSYHDSIMAAHAMDADWDGQNEVLIGTYGRQLMVFKQLPPGQEPYTQSRTKRRLAQAVERMREIKEMREILEQLRRDNRKLVEDQRVKEEREKSEEEEKERREKEVKEAEEEAERKEKEKLEQETLEKKEKEEKAIEEQMLLDEQLQQEQNESEKETSLETKHEQPEVEEIEKDEGVEADVVEAGKELASVEAEGNVQKDDTDSTSGGTETKTNRNDTEVVEEKEEDIADPAVVVMPENGGKVDEESLSDGQAVAEKDSFEQDSLQESQEQAPYVNNAIDIGVAEEPKMTEEVRSNHSDHDEESEDDVSSKSTNQAK